MEDPYRKGLKVSIATHSALLLFLFVSGLINGCSTSRIKPKQNLDIQFTVAIPEDMIESAETHEEVPEPVQLEEDDIPMPDPIPKEEIKEPPKPKEAKKVPVVKSDKIIERKTPGEIIKKPQQKKETLKTTDPQLTPDEIKKLLDMEATPSDTTNVPGENERCLYMMKETLYKAWIRPSASNKTAKPAVIEIRLGSSGAVLNRRLVSSSGNAELDDSAMAAAAAVPVFKNLTPGFLKKYKTVTIEFELE